ncbi:MAG: hypothetical protein MI725_08500 [Pirellulales bacterium]|nr:hypothetical protein [Pirellulales bacterium]
MSARSTVHRLLFQALLEIRERGHDSGDKVVFHLADLFHNAVLQMEEAEQENDEDKFEQVLDFLQQRAKEKGCENWVEQQLHEFQAKSTK